MPHSLSSTRRYLSLRRLCRLQRCCHLPLGISLYTSFFTSLWEGRATARGGGRGTRPDRGAAPLQTPLRISTHVYKHEAQASGSVGTRETHSLARRACISGLWPSEMLNGVAPPPPDKCYADDRRHSHWNVMAPKILSIRSVPASWIVQTVG